MTESSVQGQHFPLGTRLDSVEELRQIREWSAIPDLDCWMNSFTVYSGQAGVDRSNATSETLAALRWIQERTSHPQYAPILPTVESGTGSPRSVVGEVFRIQSTGRASDATTSTEWIGRLTGDLRKPVLTMEWEHDRLPANPPCRADSGSRAMRPEL
jgi:hypothetical protein